jgi:hypothetical protein
MFITWSSGDSTACSGIKITVFWNGLPCGLTDGHQHLEEHAASIFRAEVEPVEEKWYGRRRERAINCCVQGHWHLRFQDLLSNLCHCVFPHFHLQLLFIYLFLFLLFIYLLLFISFLILHLPPHLWTLSSLQLMRFDHSKYSPLFVPPLCLGFVYFAYFILSVFVSLPHLPPVLLHFHLWHLPQNSPF